MTRCVAAVLLDLDDTLYPQAQFLAGAWAAVAAAAQPYGIRPDHFRRHLHEIAAEGSDRGRIIDRALAACGDGTSDVTAPIDLLLRAFREHRPTRLDLYPGAHQALEQLSGRVPIGLITDGDADGQEAKIAALGLEHSFDVVVLSDRLGRSFRKPHSAPFLAALRALGVDAADAVMIGDRPDKDVAGATAAGLRAIRVATGEYRDRADEVTPWATAPDVAAAVALLADHLPALRRDQARVARF